MIHGFKAVTYRADVDLSAGTSLADTVPFESEKFTNKMITNAGKQRSSLSSFIVPQVFFIVMIQFKD
jgi:hypothetical protein